MGLSPEWAQYKGQATVMEQQFIKDVEITEEFAGLRMDKALSELIEGVSRSRIQQWIRNGQVQFEGVPVETRGEAMLGQVIHICADLAAEVLLEPEDIPLDIVFEDEHLLVVNKPVGLVVHPGAGNMSGTLVNGLLHHDPTLESLPRAGLVHRIDKDTSGLLVIAKTVAAHGDLVEQLQTRQMGREYEAVARGVIVSGGTVDAPIARDPRDRQRMAIRDEGREAVTHYRVLERFRSHTRLRLKLDTGRTHQIRLHMAHIKRPLVGDPVYGGRGVLAAGMTNATRDFLNGFRRQALHARKLSIIHPSSRQPMVWQVPAPMDMQQLITVLRRDTEENAA